MREAAPFSGRADGGGAIAKTAPTAPTASHYCRDARRIMVGTLASMARLPTTLSRFRSHAPDARFQYGQRMVRVSFSVGPGSNALDAQSVTAVFWREGQQRICAAPPDLPTRPHPTGADVRRRARAALACGMTVLSCRVVSRISSDFVPPLHAGTGAAARACLRRTREPDSSRGTACRRASFPDWSSLSPRARTAGSAAS